MLDSLDTLIAFTLIFTVVSLLVTIVVQMITSALNLRGCNLSYGLAETFETINPDLAKDAKKLAENLLRDPLLSDKQLMLLALAAYFTYVINAGQFIWKLRMARLEAPARPGSMQGVAA